MSGDTIACHLGDIGSKQIFTKTGSYKVKSAIINSCIPKILSSLSRAIIALFVMWP